MNRYAHLYMPAKGDSYPTQVVIIDVDVTLERISREPLIERECLLKWYAKGQRYVKGLLQKEYSATGSTAREFWERIDRWLLEGTITWLFANQAARILSLLEFWDLLESGNIYLSGEDPRDQGGNDGERGNRQNGLCVMEDPPVIILAKRKGRCGTLKIVDFRNYGINPGSDTKLPADRIHVLSQTVARMVAILRQNGLGSLRETSGSQGIYSLRRRFLTYPIQVHTYDSALQLERQSYHGGRCECFYLGECRQSMYLLDVKSMYASQCIANNLPSYLIESRESTPIDVLQILMEKNLIIADVTLSTSRPDYPALADITDRITARPYPYWDKGYRTKERPQTIYPIGTFRTCLAGPELSDALFHDRIKMVHQVNTYEGNPILKEWCQYWYNLLLAEERDGNKDMRSYIKSVIVASIGKFGAAHHRWLDAPDVPASQPYCSWTLINSGQTFTRYRSIAWHTQREEIGPNGPESVPSIAAYVTSYARVRLLHLIRLAGYNHVYYCDTDSLIVDQEGYDTLRLCEEIKANELGYLREENASVECEIMGIKHYKIGDRLVFAGLPKGSTLDTNKGGICWHWQSPGDSIANGIKPQPRRRLLIYSVHPLYLHGVPCKDGRVIPWEWGDRCYEQKTLQD